MVVLHVEFFNTNDYGCEGNTFLVIRSMFFTFNPFLQVAVTSFESVLNSVGDTVNSTQLDKSQPFDPTTNKLFTLLNLNYLQDDGEGGSADTNQVKQTCSLHQSLINSHSYSAAQGTCLHNIQSNQFVFASSDRHCLRINDYQTNHQRTEQLEWQGRQ